MLVARQDDDDDDDSIFKLSVNSLFNGISTLYRLFNAKVILKEEQ